jgi:(hydroxyamino)benzene mutase
MEVTTPRRLKFLGMFLFMLGLITGLALMNFTNPRMALSAHLEGIMNGLFLIAAGFLWTELKLSNGLLKAAYWLLLYGTFANWSFTLLSAILGTSKITPIAGAGHEGSSAQETILTAGFTSVGISMVIAVAILLYGLRPYRQAATNSNAK